MKYAIGKNTFYFYQDLLLSFNFNSFIYLIDIYLVIILYRESVFISTIYIDIQHIHKLFLANK